MDLLIKIEKNIRFLYLLFIMLFLFGCAKRPMVKLPPVKEGWRQSKSVKFGYKVQKNDTLYSIAWALGLDYRYLAKINNIQPPYVLRYGQRLQITDLSYPMEKQTYIAKQGQLKTSCKPLKSWKWPTNGKVKLAFDKKLGGNQGIDIGGVYGQSVLASHAGKVVYSGAGIRSYGNLIIIKHNDDYLSAYGYNSSVLVDEGKTVKAGEKIATLGRDIEGHPRLHFEIRLLGKPVNPLLYLPKR